MPPKKQIQLQVEIDTQDSWDTFIGQEGLGGVYVARKSMYEVGSPSVLLLTVIDVYSAWCGPCKAVLSLFRRIKNELGDDLLRFAIAKSDTIDSLEPYRQQSEPTFLFFAVSLVIHSQLSMHLMHGRDNKSSVCIDIYRMEGL